MQSDRQILWSQFSSQSSLQSALSSSPTSFTNCWCDRRNTIMYAAGKSCRRPRIGYTFPMCKAGSDAQHAKLWQDDAEPAAKGGEVEAVDGPIAVEVQVRGVGLIPGHRAEGRPERGEVESVDRLVAIHVAVQA